jgi:hypothetical protein
MKPKNSIKTSALIRYNLRVQNYKLSNSCCINVKFKC